MASRLGIPGTATSERSLFIGPNIPNEIKSLGKQLKSIDKHTFRSLVKLIITDFEGKPVNEETYKTLKNSVNQPENFDVIYCGLYKLLRCAYRLPETTLKQEVYKEDLKELKIPDELTSDLVSVVFGSRKAAVEKASIENGPQLPHLKNLRWRTNVTISTSVLSRVLEPSILMEITTTDGNIRTFEMSAAKFAQLRYSVATLLKEMEEVEKRNVIKS